MAEVTVIAVCFELQKSQKINPDTKHAPWYIVSSDDKKRARLNCISHLLKLIPYKRLHREEVKLPKRSMKDAYDDEATMRGRKFIPQVY